MCLGIPGQVVELSGAHEHLARVDVNGVGRTINIGLLEDEDLRCGDWVLIHVGFAMSKIDEEEAPGARLAEDARRGLHRRSRRAARRRPRNPHEERAGMRFVDEYRDPAAARRLVAHITDQAGDDHFKFMEVCGGHTHTIYRHGIEHLPTNVELVHGPGCPVVIPMGRVDDAIAVAEEPGVLFTSFGDMMRVPGGHGNLLEAKARARTSASCTHRWTPSNWPAAPGSTGCVLRGRLRDHGALDRGHPPPGARLGIANFKVFCNHVTIVPPIKAILDSPDLRLDGFLGPGHVSTVVGNRPYRFVPEQYGKPLVTAGFEPLDILQAIAMLLAQLRQGRCEVENQYTRVVRDEGNPALRCWPRCSSCDRTSSGGAWASSRRAPSLRRVRRLRRRTGLRPPGVRVADPKACQCGEVLKGVIKPWECKVFGTACTPDPDRDLHGVVGGRLRGLLQLRPPAPGRRGQPRPVVARLRLGCWAGCCPGSAPVPCIGPVRWSSGVTSSPEFVRFVPLAAVR